MAEIQRREDEKREEKRRKEMAKLVTVCSITFIYITCQGKKLIVIHLSVGFLIHRSDLRVWDSRRVPAPPC